jgi:hypothetical protein
MGGVGSGGVGWGGGVCKKGEEGENLGQPKCVP